MIIYNRQPYATNVVQTICRGNRDPKRNQVIASHIFIHSNVSRTILEMHKRDFANQEEAIQTLCEGVTDLFITAKAT
jgi:hypothetical protein